MADEAGPLSSTVVRAGERISRLSDSLVRTRWDALAFGVLFVAGAYIYYANLGGSNLQSWDEGFYADMSRMILRGGPWIVPKVNWVSGGTVATVPFLLKPPGAFWIEALSMAVFGANEFGARFPSATFAILIGGLTYVVGRDLFDRRTGFVAGLVWMTTPYAFAGMNGGRNGGTDMEYVFFGTLFVYFVWKALADDEPRYFYCMGFAAAAALLIKGFAAGIFVIVTLPLVLRYVRRLLKREFAVGVGITVLLVAPWAILAWLQYRDRLVQQLFVQEVLKRAEGNPAHSAPGTFAFMNFPYFRRLPTFFDPWLYFLLPAIAVDIGVAVRSRWQRVTATRMIGKSADDVDKVTDGNGCVERRTLANESARWSNRPLVTTLFLIWWTGIVLAFFAVTGNHAWYLLPMYVPAALLVGRLCGLAAEVSTRPVAVAGLVAGTVLTAAFSFRIGVWPLIRYRLQGHVPGGLWFAIVLVVALLVVAFEAELRSAVNRRVGGSTRLWMVAVAVLAFAVVSATAAPVEMGGSNGYDQQKALGTLVDQQAPPDAVVYVVRGTTNGGAFHSLAFYANRTLQSATMHRVKTDDRVRYVFARQRRISSLDRDYRVIGTMRDSHGRYTLVELTERGRSDANRNRSDASLVASA